MLTCILLFHLLGNSLAGYLDLGMTLLFPSPSNLYSESDTSYRNESSYFNYLVLISVQIA
jgi:hypothetical protein